MNEDPDSTGWNPVGWTLGVITDSDLPQAVRDKLAMRKELRAQLR